MGRYDETERVYVFRQSGQDWVEEGDEDGPPFDSPGIPGLTVIGSSFGEAVAVYQDTLLVGDDDLTISTPPNTQKVGRAYIFKRTGSSWELALNVANPAATSDAEHFGESVGLHGRWAVIGAPQFDVGDQPAQGAVHLYRTNSAGEYELHSMLTASDGSAGNKFGLSVAIRSGILLIGAPTRAPLNMERRTSIIM